MFNSLDKEQKMDLLFNHSLDCLVNKKNLKILTNNTDKFFLIIDIM